MSAEEGVYSDGFSIMVQPAASAGATLQAIWFSGQFHGVIIPTTPTGSRTIIAEPEPLLERITLEDIERRHEVAEAGAGLKLLRKAQRRAHFIGDGPADVLHPALVDLDDPAKQLDALLARCERVRLERAARGRNGLVHVLCGTEGDLVQDLLRSRD